jgi:RHS repeat-associated protein
VQSPLPQNPAWGDEDSDRLGCDGAGRQITKRYLQTDLDDENDFAYASTTPIVGFTTAFDKASNKLFERELHAENRSHLYEPISESGVPQGGYDSLDRLRQYQRGTLSNGTGGDDPLPAGGSIAVDSEITLPGTDKDRTYDLDGVGNWKKTTFDAVTGGAGVDHRTHNGTNELIRSKGSVPTVQFQYDQNGNLTRDGLRQYKWDAVNRLVECKRNSDDDVIGTYTYDAMGRRIRKVIPDLSGGDGGLSGDIPAGTTDYIYQGVQCIEERDGSDEPVRQYVWGRYIDELIQMRESPYDSPVDRLMLSDLLYRGTALVDADSGDIVEAYDTDAYGNTLIFVASDGGDWWSPDATQGKNPTCPFIFTGRRYDPETEIYFYRARYYVPELGRFISKDFNDYSDGPNCYEYTISAPTVLLDPLGLEVTYPAADKCKDCCCLLIQLVYDPRSKQGQGYRDAQGQLFAGNTTITQSIDALVATNDFKKHCATYVRIEVSNVNAGEFRGFDKLKEDIAKALTNDECKNGVKHILVFGHASIESGRVAWPTEKGRVSDPNRKYAEAGTDRIERFTIHEPVMDAEGKNAVTLREALMAHDKAKNTLTQIDLEACYSGGDATRLINGELGAVRMGGYRGFVGFGKSPPKAPRESDKRYYGPRGPNSRRYVWPPGKVLKIK